MRILVRRPVARSRAAGLTILETTIAMAILFTALLASAQTMATSIAVVNDSQRLNRAAIFLETVMEDLSAQPYANLLAFDGNRLNERATAAASLYAVDLTVFQAAVDLVQVQAVLRDQRTNRELGRVSTLRSRR